MYQINRKTKKTKNDGSLRDSYTPLQWKFPHGLEQ